MVQQCAAAQGSSMGGSTGGRLVWLVFAVIGLGATSSGLFAQQSGATSLEEIVVTARKREESLQETPIAVTAFSAIDLEKRSLTNLMEVGSFVPNVSMATGQSSSGGSNNGQVYIRGVGQSDFLFTTDPGVGIYIDGVYHPRTLGAVMDLLDLERIEVLRGPQGTLFGKNTIGGALNVIPAKPTGEFGGYAEVTFGSFDRTDFRGGIDFPISETLFAKAALSYKNRDGYGDRLDFATGTKIDESGDEDQIGGRAALRWLASDDITVDFSFDYTREREKSVPYTLLEVDTSAAAPTQLWNALIGGPSGLPFTSAFITGDPDTSYATGPNRNNMDAWGVNATVEWDLGRITVKSITAYREIEALFGGDGDASPLPINSTEQAQDQNQISQELQLLGTGFDDHLKWVVGLFYFDEFGRDANDVRLTSGLFNVFESLPGPLDGSLLAAPTAPGGPGNPINVALDLDFDIFNEIDITSVALFSQATVDFTDRLSLTGGIRYTYEKKDYFLEHRRIASNTFIVPATTVSASWNEPTYMASLQYQWTDDLMTYASFSRGFKSGGFNGRPILSALDVDPYDPEFLNSLEIGLKSEWFDRRLRLNIAGFFYDYEDMQFNTISNDPNTGTLLLIVDNVAAAEVQGFEVEIQAVPVDGLDISGALGYTDFEITEVDPGVRDITLTTQMQRTPQWNGSVSVQYTLPREDFGIFSIRGDFAYEDNSYADTLNTSSAVREAHTIINARVTWQLDNMGWGDGWELTAFGTNLTDRRVIVSGFSTLTSFGDVTGFYNRPREWGVSIRKNF